MFTPLIQALTGVNSKTYHYKAAANVAPPYIVWAEDSRLDLSAGNVHAEKAWQGTIDLFTLTEDDPMVAQIEAAIEPVVYGWTLNSVQYEEETHLIHYEWVWTAHA